MAGFLHLSCLVLVAAMWSYAEAERLILVFGGNGFLGASTVENFLANGDNVTMVNRGNWYWDSENRILPKVRHIKCDRKASIDECSELVNFIKEQSHFDAVVDFSAYGGYESKQSSALLKNKVGLYILISTDSVYEVSDKKHDGHSQETDAARPESMDDQVRLSKFNAYGHNKLEAEEAILNQRLEGGFPFVILRLPDVLGPRDTTYRTWIYHLWTKIAAEGIPDRPVRIPYFLEDYGISFVYSEDVGKMAMELVSMGPQIKDQAINLAYPEPVTLKMLLDDMNEALGITEPTYSVQDPGSQSHDDHMYFYPTVRRGPIDVTKASSLLNWTPTPWKEMIKETVQFYESAMVDERFHTQKDEIVQIVAQQIYPDDKDKFYEAVEKVYDINLHHFKPVKDEL